MQCQLEDPIGEPRQIYSPAAYSTGSRVLRGGGRKKKGFTLIEVVMAIAIVALVFAGIINAYIQAGLRLEWTGYSLAAQSLAIESIEQARSCLWDPAETPPVNEVTNLNLMNMTYNSTNNSWSGYSTNILDVPYESSNYVLATNYVQISMVSISSNANIQVVQVQTVWPFFIRAQNLYFTNTACTIISPDNRAPSTF